MGDPGAKAAKVAGEALEAALKKEGVVESLTAQMEKFDKVVKSIARDVFKDNKEAESAACDHILGLNASVTGVSSIQDVVHSWCRYNAAVAHANKGGPSQKADDFYNGHLSDAVTRTWRLVAEDHGCSEHVLDISACAGICLLGLVQSGSRSRINPRVFLRFPLKLISFGEMKERMDRLLACIEAKQSHLNRGNKRRYLCPSEEAVRNVLSGEGASRSSAVPGDWDSGTDDPSDCAAASGGGGGAGGGEGAAALHAGGRPRGPLGEPAVLRAGRRRASRLGPRGNNRAPSSSRPGLSSSCSDVSAGEEPAPGIGEEGADGGAENEGLSFRFSLQAASSTRGGESSTPGSDDDNERLAGGADDKAALDEAALDEAALDGGEAWASGEEEEQALRELMGDDVSEDDVLTFGSLLDGLLSCRLDGNGDVEMSHDDWNTCENSLLVMSAIYSHLQSKFHPKEGGPVPLDVLAGATPARKGVQCMTPKGPRMNVHLQKDPRRPGRHVGVIAFEEYVSKEYFEDVPDALGDLQFQHFKDSTEKFLRVSTTLEGELPLMTFGNSGQMLTFYQATPQVMPVERKILAMTKYVHREVDSVLKRVKAILKHHLHLRCAKPDARAGESTRDSWQAGAPGADPRPRRSSRKRRSSLQRREKGRASKRGAAGVNAPTGCDAGGASPNDDVEDGGCRDEDPKAGGPRHALHLGEDFPDSLAWHVTRCKPYGHHSDSRPFKPCNHDNRANASHEKRFRIMTHCVAMPLDPEEEVPDKLVTIRHGYPDANPKGHSHEMCLPYGHFSGKEGRFVRWEEGQEEAIPLGTACHAHMQMPGSQGALHHFIQAERGTGDKFIRAIASPRVFGPFRQSIDGREEAWEGKVKENNVVYNGSHHHRNVLGILKNEERHFTEVDGGGEASDTVATARGPPEKGKRKRKRWDGKTTHKCTEDLQPGEAIVREAVVGAPHNANPEAVARSAEIGRKLMRECTSVMLKLKSGKGSVYVGPIVKAGKGGQVELLRPGHPLKESAVDGNLRLRTRRQMKPIANTVLGDGIHLRREGKNTKSVLDNVETALKGEGKLIPMTIRGSGGALYKAGQRMMTSKSRGSYREAPTHVVSLGQKWTPFCKMMDDCCLDERVLNVFFQGIYLGPFFVSETKLKRMKEKDAASERVAFDEKFADLHELDEVQFPSKRPRDGSYYEISSMMAVGRWFTLTPLDEDFVTKYGPKDANRRWRMVNMTSDDFVVPMFSVSKDDVGEEFGRKFVDVHSLTRHSEGLSAITEDALAREMPDRVGDVQGGHVRTGKGAKFSQDHMECALVHAAGITLAKTCMEGVVDKKKGTMAPPRDLLRDIPGLESEDFVDLMTMLNLKPLCMKGVHPGHLSHEAAVHLAVASTGGYHPSLRMLGADGTWLHRNGRAYVMDASTRDEAGQLMFQATLCAITNPSTMVDIFLMCPSAQTLPDPARVAPLPGSEYLGEFMETLKTHDIGRPGLLHTNFFKQLTEDDYIKLVTELASEPGKLFRDAIQQADKDGGGRTAVLTNLKGSLNGVLGDETLTEFNVQVIMRTIEMCLHEPFGTVDEVPQGTGGSDAADTSTDQWSGLYPESRKEEFDTGKKPTATSMPARIVAHLNEWARLALFGDDEGEKARMQKLLSVTCLEWSDGMNCLVHSLGIGKRFDASDAEHLLCLVHTLHQATLPARTISKEIQVDTAKHFPIRVNKGDLEARAMPFMVPFLKGWEMRVDAYKALLGDSQFKHQKLMDIFRIDGVQAGDEASEEGEDGQKCGLPVLDEDEDAGDDDEGGNWVVSDVDDPEGNRVFVDEGREGQPTAEADNWLEHDHGAYGEDEARTCEAETDADGLGLPWDVEAMAEEASEMMAALGAGKRTAASEAELNYRLMMVPRNLLCKWGNSGELLARKTWLMDRQERNHTNNGRVEEV